MLCSFEKIGLKAIIRATGFRQARRIGNRISQLGLHIFDDPDVDLTISRLENFFREMGSPIRCQEIGLEESHKTEILALMNKNKSNGKNPENFLEDEDRLRIVEHMFAE